MLKKNPHNLLMLDLTSPKMMRETTKELRRYYQKAYLILQSKLPTKELRQKVGEIYKETIEKLK